MKAFILAAGKGTRMRPLTTGTPKPLLPVAGKPIIQHIVDSLEDFVDEIVVLVGWKGRMIEDSLSSSKAELSFTRQNELLGTADAVSNAERYIDEKFICMNGDVILLPQEIKNFVDFFEEEDTSVVGTVPVEEPGSYGVMVKEGDMIKEIMEKPNDPPSDLVNAGIYGFTPEIFGAIDETERSSRGEYEITDSLELLMDEEKLRGYELKRDTWFELSRPWELLSVNKELMGKGMFEEKREGEIQEGVHMEGKVSIEKGATVKRGSYIKGPVHISSGAEIGPNCLIRGATTIQEGCKVGNAVEVKNTILMEGSNVPHHNYVGDSVIGKNCNFGSGTKVANLRLDEKNINVVQNGEEVQTGRRKLGTIMGDDVKTGINAMINTGTIIGQGTLIGPGALAEGELGRDSRIQ